MLATKGFHIYLAIRTSNFSFFNRYMPVQKRMISPIRVLTAAPLYPYNGISTRLSTIAVQRDINGHML